MEGQQPNKSLTSNATRKRRSSILKSQRPPRTPFSELEFKVDTPTDVTKSRRVSFSRRTGVAEFATNEATTTWKTFYEEHNKSLESSSNDSEVKVLKQSIGYLGNRCFDDQFQDIEADIDYVNTPGNPRNRSIDISANFNLAEQLEITENGKTVTAPHQNFELSSFTDRQTKLFGDELTNPIAVKMSEQIDIDFSIMQNIGDDIVEDDLDYIQNDVKQAHINMKNNRSDVSQYIKVDFNRTQVIGTNDESDMSITDTVHSPKVQENRSNSSIKSEKSVTMNKDWVTDKENIFFNPYAAPAKKFVVNEEPSKVLVFDGKRVTVQSETMVPTKQNLSKEAGKQRRTIVLNVDDDLPNFIDQDISNINKNKDIAYITENHRHTIIFSDDNDLSMTQALVNNINLAEAEAAYQNSFGNMSMTQGIPDIVKLNKNSIENGKTTVFNSDSGNISFTQALPSKIVLSRLKTDIAETLESKTNINETCNVSITQAVPNDVNLAHQNTQMDREKRRTSVYENCDMSMTQVVPAHVILADNNVPLTSEKGRTILYDKDDGDISITQALPSNLILLEKAQNSANKNKTLVFDDNDIVGNISVTQALPANIIIEKNKKDLNKSNLNVTETSSISLTQMVPENIILSEKTTGDKRKTIYDADKDISETSSISLTQMVPENIILSEKTTGDKRKTIYDADKDISLTQTIPNNLILSAKAEVSDKYKSIDYDDNYIGNKSMTSAFPANVILPNDEKLVTEKRKTIIFDDDSVNVSITQALSGNILVQTQVPNALRRHTLIAQDTEVSMTEVISNRIIENNIADLVLNDSHEDDMDMSITQHVPQERNETAPKDDNKKLTISKAYINESCGISMSQAVPNNVIKADDNSTEIGREKRRTVLYDNDSCNLSMTKPIPTELVTLQDEFLESSPNKNAKDTPHSAFHSSMGQDIIVYQAVTDSSGTNIALTKTEQGDSENQELLKNYSYVKPPMSSADEKVADENASYNLLENHGTDDKSMMEVDDVEEQKEGIVKTEVNSKFSYIVDKTEIESKISDVKSLEIIPAKISILNDLLDMSNASLVDGIDDKNIMTKIESETPSNVSKTDKDASNESLFYIIRDCDDDVQTDHVNDDENQDESIHSDQNGLGEGRKSLKFSDHVQEIVERTPLPLEYVQESEPGVERDLKDNLTKLQSILDESPPEIMQEIDAADADVSDHLNESKANEMQECDDTKELLEMLSNFTGPQKTFNEIDDEADEPAIIKEHNIALEDKKETFAAKRYSLAPSRLSVVLSKEDMMNNISMAKAMLQKSRLEMDSSDYMQESTINTPGEQCSSHKKSVRLSNDVVKTLHFEDESKSEISMESEEKLSPIRKTVFGETSYMQDNKAKVIPSYLKDVSDGIKELMLDLVKPMADVMPFEAAAPDKSLNRNPSTCSTQIQANLVTSSQVDLEGELQSAAESYSEVNKLQSLTTEIAKMGDKAVTQALKSYHSEYSTKSLESEVNSDSNCQVTYIQPKIQQQHKSPKSGRVLYFDPSNPLNNVMLTPVDFSDAHRYNPIESAESLAASEQSDSLHASSKDKEPVDAERVSIQYNLDKVTLSSAIQHSGDALSDSVEKSNSLVSNVSKRTSIDQAIDVKMTDVKDMDCNTVIVMKGNKELLDASSSLTLVDDALTHKAFDVDIESPSNSSQDENTSQSQGKSPVELIYKVNKQDKNKTKRVDSDVTSEYDDEPARPLKKAAKAKKRSYSPTKRDKHKHCALSSLDVTPKPLSKIVRRSDSPASLQMNAENESQNKLIAERDTPNNTPEKEQASRKTSKDASGTTPQKKSTPEKKKKSPRRSKDSPKKENPGTTITVQRLLTEFKMKDRIDEKKLNEEILAALSKESNAAMESESSEVCVSAPKSPEVVSSCTSSKNQSEMRAQRSCVSTNSRATSKPSSSSAWDPAPAPAAPAAPALVTECESSVNVVAKIDMLPFMGTHECEWESSIGDTWSFRLLHARLRLSVRLEHRHDNAPRTRVLADTPVRSVTIETVVHDKKNSVAVLCVRYAAEAMRFWVGRGCARALDVVALLRRCAGVARVALRWGRAMHEAYLHLAYSLTDDGRLSLKVANVPLRSVWEVSMRLELVVEDARETPWPRAGDVRVAAVVSDYCVRDQDVQRAVRAVPHDWGHAPRTIWRIFKYLKNKTRDDDLLLGLC